MNATITAKNFTAAAIATAALIAGGALATSAGATTSPEVDAFTQVFTEDVVNAERIVITEHGGHVELTDTDTGTVVEYWTNVGEGITRSGYASDLSAGGVLAYLDGEVEEARFACNADEVFLTVDGTKIGIARAEVVA